MTTGSDRDISRAIKERRTGPQNRNHSATACTTASRSPRHISSTRDPRSTAQINPFFDTTPSGIPPQRSTLDDRLSHILAERMIRSLRSSTRSSTFAGRYSGVIRWIFSWKSLTASAGSGLFSSESINASSQSAERPPPSLRGSSRSYMYELTCRHVGAWASGVGVSVLITVLAISPSATFCSSSRAAGISNSSRRHVLHASIVTGKSGRSCTAANRSLARNLLSQRGILVPIAPPPRRRERPAHSRNLAPKKPVFDNPLTTKSSNPSYSISSSNESGDGSLPSCRIEMQLLSAWHSICVPLSRQNESMAIAKGLLTFPPQKLWMTVCFPGAPPIPVDIFSMTMCLSVGKSQLPTASCSLRNLHRARDAAGENPYFDSNLRCLSLRGGAVISLITAPIRREN